MVIELPDEDFWNRRYATCRQGSGVGSRGVFAKRKLSIVRGCVKQENIKSVIDLGCGDLYWVKHLNTPKYTGIDFSQTIIEKNQQIKPNWDFRFIDFSKEKINERADLTLCFDVLIHQPTFEQYNTVIENTLRTFKTALLISGWTFKPERCPPTMYFYETIFEAFKGRGLSYQEVYIYRESTILKVKK